MRHKTLIMFLAAVFCMVLGSSRMQAQQNGSIVGTVTDPSGAVIPGAKVTATNTATSQTQSTLTSGAGTYTITQVAPGTYTVAVEKTGFQRYASSGVVVQVATAADVSVVLQVGATTQTVNVRADTSLLQASTTSTGTVITGQANDELPLSLGGGVRNPMNFVELTPGVSWVNGNYLDLEIGGGQIGDTSFLLDGSETMSSRHNGGAFGAGIDNGIQFAEPVSADAVSEFKVQTGTYSAQYGRFANGIMNYVTKSGTNQLHGGLFEYLKNTALDTRGFYDKTTPVTIENNFGGTVGGPIIIPHVYDGRNKAFFFVAWDRAQYVAYSSAGLTSVPSMRERQGDFSDWVTSTGALIPIYDPTTTAIVNGVVTRTQFPGNIIPPTDIVPQAIVLNKLLPPPNLPGILDNEYTASSIGATEQNYSFQIDFNPTPNDHIEFFFSNPTTTSLPATGPLPGPLENNYNYGTYSTYYRFNYDHIISPTLMNHLNLGLNRQTWPQVAPVYMSAADRAAISVLGVAYNDPHVPPQYSVGPFGTWGSATDNVQPMQLVNINDALTSIHGRHTLQAGFDFITEYYNVRNCVLCAGAPVFATGQTGVPSNANSGAAYASLLLGQVSSGSYLFPSDFTMGNNYYAWFLQDDFKATKKLTINMGLRYDIPIPSREKYAREDNFCPSCSNPAAGGIFGAVAFTGNGPGRNGLRSFQTTRTNAWGPRLGLPTKSPLIRCSGAAEVFTIPLSENRAKHSTTLTALPAPTASALRTAMILRSLWLRAFQPPHLLPTLIRGLTCSALPLTRRPVADWRLIL